jgi:hypothetical protein
MLYTSVKLILLGFVALKKESITAGCGYFHTAMGNW